MMLFPRPPETEVLVKTICEIRPGRPDLFPRCGGDVPAIADFPDVGKYTLSKKLYGCISGAGPLHRNVKERFEAEWGRLFEGYGLSEAFPVVSGGPISDVEHDGARSDWPSPPPVEDRRPVQPVTGNAVGESGELIMTGPTVMQGYLNNPAETADTVRVR